VESALGGRGIEGAALPRLGVLATASRRHHLLVRRSIGTGEFAYYYAFVPEAVQAADIQRERCLLFAACTRARNALVDSSSEHPARSCPGRRFLVRRSAAWA
jgi:hypothetical protein